jgi:hypothetical protein
MSTTIFVKYVLSSKLQIINMATVETSNFTRQVLCSGNLY